MPLTDLVIASKQEAQDIADSNYPLEKWTGIDTRGIDIVPYSVLYCLLTKKDWQPEILDEFPLISEETAEGPRVASFPEKLKAILASLTDNELNEISLAWAETDELSGIESGAIKDLLDEIRTLAKKADSSNKDILLWMSL